MNERLRKSIIIIVGIVMVLLMALSFGGRERITAVESGLGSLIAPIQRFFSQVGNFIDEKTDPILNVLNYKTINEDLTKENEMLKEQVVDLTMTQKEYEELQTLKLSLNYVDRYDIDNYISCSVISKDIGNWFNMFTIDAGSNQGITKNSTVINGNGLVGLVYEVGDEWAKVISIIDHKSSVGFEMLRVSDDFDGIIMGTTNYELVGEFYDTQANVNVNDYVVTSGIGMYPKGILIGQIYEIVDDRDLFLKQIKVEPAVDFKKLNKVMVIPYNEDNESEISTYMP